VQTHDEGVPHIGEDGALCLSPLHLIDDSARDDDVMMIIMMMINSNLKDYSNNENI